jgi:hypothetical protein
LGPLTVELTLSPSRAATGGVHVEGTARVGPGAPQAFSGWMALLQVLEAMVERAGDTP